MGYLRGMEIMEIITNITIIAGILTDQQSAATTRARVSLFLSGQRGWSLGCIHICVVYVLRLTLLANC